MSFRKNFETGESEIFLEPIMHPCVEFFLTSMKESEGIEFEAKILKPELVTKEFPSGFGIELKIINKEGGHFEDFIEKAKTFMREILRAYGAVVLPGMDVKKAEERKKVPFSTVSNKTSYLESWHFDRDYQKDGKNMFAIVLAQEESDEPRPIPTLVAPTLEIGTLIQRELQRELEEGDSLPDEIKKYYSELLQESVVQLLNILNDGFISLSYLNNPILEDRLIKLLRAIEKKYPSSILSHDWVQQKGSVILIYTEEQADQCTVSHARIFDRNEYPDKNDPRNQEYYLERAFLYE